MAVGRTVHYVLPGSGRHRPAIVTEVFSASECSIHVFLTPDDPHAASPEIAHVRESEECDHGSFHSPERVL
jgi:hypothetical protein